MINVYCDGGCRGNHKKENIGGYGGLIVFPNGQVIETRGYALDTTNNAMEIRACIESLKLIIYKDEPVTVTSDSLYMVRGINEWSIGWIRNDWVTSKDEPVSNKDLWLELIALKHLFKDIKFIHCKGHADNEGNNRADELANMAMDNLSRKLHSL